MWASLFAVRGLETFSFSKRVYVFGKDLQQLGFLRAIGIAGCAVDSGGF